MDLDGTLTPSDLLLEALLRMLRAQPLQILALPFWLLRGKAYMKRQIAKRVMISVETLPFDQRVLEQLRHTRQRPRVLCTASDSLLAQPVADHLGCFEEVIASDGSNNLAGRLKAEALVSRFGTRGFDYVANGKVDLHVWKHAHSAWVVNAPHSLAKAAARITALSGHLSRRPRTLLHWLRAIRLHQWLKNLLIFVPVLAAHRFTDPASISHAAGAFLAFGLCASGVYVLNDLLDLESDRNHPRKRFRPFAAGTLPLAHGILAAPLLTLTGLALAAWLDAAFLLVLCIYYLTTLAYSFRLKQVHMLDVMILAGLYTIRILGGAVAAGVPLSFWLLAFSMFVFLSLAMLKRYTELASLATLGKQEASGRGYTSQDHILLLSLGGASGYLSVLVLALYIDSPDSMQLYTRSEALWMLCPLLLYWISRAWSLAHRGRMHDDPVVFALTDRGSLALGALSALAVAVAI